MRMAKRRLAIGAGRCHWSTAEAAGLCFGFGSFKDS